MAFDAWLRRLMVGRHSRAAAIGFFLIIGIMTDYRKSSGHVLISSAVASCFRLLNIYTCILSIPSACCFSVPLWLHLLLHPEPPSSPMSYSLSRNSSSSSSSPQFPDYRSILHLHLCRAPHTHSIAFQLYISHLGFYPAWLC